MDKNKYKETASAIEEYVCGQLAGKYLQAAQDIDRCGGDIAHHLKQLENRSREYHNPSFVVLVVGPVKSGKSTFVNLVARNYVSPTHFLECTVRPSLIFAGSEEKLTVYRSTDASHKEQQTNSIIDSINGLAEESGLTNVRKEVYAHTRKNIDRYVKLGNVSVDKDDILLTSIETHGGKLLQDHVYLVDMAGFDGDRVNFDTPAYKAIIERADLIVFVQSSNSAISKLSASFFELLQKKNHSVPVCLVHNVFESAYWRDEESKQRDIEEQKEYAVEQIKAKYNLVLDEGYAFNLNLGKVDDWRNGNFRPELKESLEQEAARFEQAESAMYELFRKRESIRLANCIARTSIQRDVLLEHVRGHKAETGAGEAVPGGSTGVRGAQAYPPGRQSHRHGQRAGTHTDSERGVLHHQEVCGGQRREHLLQDKRGARIRASHAGGNLLTHDQAGQREAPPMPANAVRPGVPAMAGGSATAVGTSSEPAQRERRVPSGGHHDRLGDGSQRGGTGGTQVHVVQAQH